MPVLFDLTPLDDNEPHFAMGLLIRIEETNEPFNLIAFIDNSAATKLNIGPCQFLNCKDILGVTGEFKSIQEANDAINLSQNIQWELIRVDEEEFLRSVSYDDGGVPHVLS